MSNTQWLWDPCARRADAAAPRRRRDYGIRGGGTRRRVACSKA
jgi:hypothetical protein